MGSVHRSSWSLVEIIEIPVGRAVQQLSSIRLLAVPDFHPPVK